MIPSVPDSFMILNAQKMLDALDEDHSEITRWSKNIWPEKAGQVAGVARIVLKSEAIKNDGIFRIKNWEPPLFVSEVIKLALEDLQVPGIGFQVVTTI
jgi:hypothetical protein